MASSEASPPSGLQDWEYVKQGIALWLNNQPKAAEESFKNRESSVHIVAGHTFISFMERGLLLLLRYASRWGNESMRGLIDVTSVEPARHCRQFQCPCQYIEYHLKCKPQGKCEMFSFFYWVKASQWYG
ncbi:hypothetical protein pipiens_015068 [Culex pipiens pipiens]|uniref:Uncharacterized protein n=1 Tax=Culex pipiens pipiens TaxID=38569 RepID=A0ABD1CSI7_CULPP